MDLRQVCTYKPSVRVAETGRSRGLLARQPTGTRKLRFNESEPVSNNKVESNGSSTLDVDLWPTAGMYTHLHKQVYLPHMHAHMHAHTHACT